MSGFPEFFNVLSLKRSEIPYVYIKFYQKLKGSQLDRNNFLGYSFFYFFKNVQVLNYKQQKI
ncbi:MAG: hypothetical protein COZ85_02720 [Candidatus Moranbacteria bacterium CG_4_8_14_3_um_filter_34_16]|nr:MAG: hypothetical protein COT31_03765 [Candidatus Moranbacteria bacterium CG08_land_8_20_14_0_20_34_16]PIW94883.1 MAG: hypothetical protein COZ85_02720 [Candidatus Moranbacteria bacterium CG_4_8_14_3_um_filter_34_16]PJA89415.1 MAG: hypothetical protein CO138_00575 [Candidatus Moranbacteria bacterium CG_4_9_14_3_um_filter_33_15]